MPRAMPKEDPGHTKWKFSMPRPHFDYKTYAQGYAQGRPWAYTWGPAWAQLSIFNESSKFFDVEHIISSQNTRVAWEPCRKKQMI